MPSIKISLIGLGKISKTYLEVLTQLNQVSLISAVEPNPTVIENIPVHKNIDQLLSIGPIPDVAIICTPPSTHDQIAQKLLEAGIDCLIEKPVSTTAQEAHKLLQLSNKLGRKISTSAKFRFTQGLQEAKRSIDEGMIGDLRLIKNTFSSVLQLKDDWRRNPTISGGGVWADNGPHSLDVIETLAGPLKKIKTTQSLHHLNHDVEDEVLVRAIHESNAESEILLTWNRAIEAPIAHCIGTEGEIIIGWNETILKKDGAEIAIANGYEKIESFTQVIVNFLGKCSAQNIFDDHGARTLEWIEAAYRSTKSGKWETNQ